MMHPGCWIVLLYFVALSIPTVRPQSASPSPSLQEPTGGSQGSKIEPLLRAALATAPSSSTSFNINQLQNSPPTQETQLTIGQSYGNEDPIIYLDYSSFMDEILRKRTANFVYFNANFSHCRNCHKFFEIWKELAVDIRWWRHVIRLSSINCSDEDNIDLCRRAGVTQFPQVKYYWVMSNSLEQDGQRIRILGKSVHAMRHLIMDKVMDSYIEHNKILSQSKQPILAQTPAGSSIQTPASPIVSLMNPMIGQLLSGSGGGLNSIIGGLSSKSTSPQMSNLISGGQGLGQIMTALASAGNIRQRLNTKPLPGNWPELEPLEAPDSSQLINMLPLDPVKNVGALLIMETPEFLYTGLEVMLDLNPYANQTYIARVKDERSSLSKNLTKRDDIQAPTLIFVSPAREPKLVMAAPKYTNDEDLRRIFVRTFERRQIKYPVRRVWSIPANKEMHKAPGQGDSLDDDELMNKVNHVYMNDLTNAIRISLVDQVLKHPDLSDEQCNALVKYVYALINYFPFNNDKSLRFLKRLHSWLQNQVSPIDMNEYKKQLHDIDEALQPCDWVACKSLSNTKAIPATSKKSAFLYENPAQIGKVVSNITRYLRTQQQQANKLRGLLTSSTSYSSPVMLSPKGLPGSTSAPSLMSPQSNSSSSVASLMADEPSNSNESPMERIVKSLTSSSLGSDSSILRLVSSALAGGGDGDPAKGKSKFAREYPCGAWKLAHTMVVNEYLKDSPRKDVRHIVLNSLYQYMVQFYACATCGNRVSDLSGEFRLDLNDNLRDPADSVLLLWKVHNRVNKRLESELRPGSPPKLQFPPESLCPKCRAPRAQNDLLSTPNWHERQVLNFLVHHYRPKNLILNSNSSASSSSSSRILTIASLSFGNNFVKSLNYYSVYQFTCWLMGYSLIYLALSRQWSTV